MEKQRQTENEQTTNKWFIELGDLPMSNSEQLGNVIQGYIKSISTMYILQRERHTHTHRVGDEKGRVEMRKVFGVGAGEG